MKKFITPYIIIGILITCVGNFSFAQNTTTSTPDAVDLEKAYCETQTSVCGTAPEQFTLLISFVREMTNSIKTIGTEWDYLGKYVHPNRFKWNVFTAPKQTIVDKLGRNLANKVKFGMASIAIFTSPINFAGLKDMFWWIALLSKNHVFLRDNKLIEQMESHVADKQYELGLWGWWYAQIIPENRAVMQKIIDTYASKWLLVSSSIINEATYNDITFSLIQMLSAAKSFLYFGTTDKFNAMTIEAHDQPIFIGFNSDAIIWIQRNYNCARWPNYVCSAQHMKLKDVFSATWKSLSGSAVSSFKTVKDANKRLGQIFTPSQQDSGFKAREADLLRSMYGTTKISKWTLSDSLKKTWASIKKSWAEVGQEFIDLGSDVTTFRNFPKDLKGTVQNIPSLPNKPANTTETTAISKIIDDYIYDVFLSQKTALDLVSMSEVKGVTPAFKVLGQQLYVIKNDILGGKEKNDSLLKNLWEACQEQCGWWWLCR